MTKSKVLILAVTLLASIATAGSAMAQQDSEPDSGAMQHGPMMDQKGGSMGGGMMMGMMGGKPSGMGPGMMSGGQGMDPKQREDMMEKRIDMMQHQQMMQPAPAK